VTPDDRLLPFGDQLRQLRKAARITGKVLAESAGWQPSKVSRLENGQQLISEEDLATWSKIIGLGRSDSKALLDELRGIRLDEARWKNRLRGGHQVLQRSFGAAEQAAVHIRNFETGLVPGLVQTPDYARAVFTAMSELKGVSDDADAAVKARLQRQSVLYDSSKKIELLVTEAALRTPIASAGVMAGQVDRLLALLGVPNVRFGIVPLGVQLRYPPMHGFWILDDLVSVEVANTEIATRDAADVKLYSDLLASLWEFAAEGEAARMILLAVSALYQD
jgi:transcriptional regulator with XRE-family HTH domain